MGISVVVSVEFIMLAISEGAVSSILINRVVTQQPHLAQIALPICVAYIIFPSRVHVKILSAISIVPLLGMIFFSQQRGLWVGVLFSVIVIGGFRYLFDQITIGRLIKYCLLVMLSFAILFGFFLLIDKLFFGSVFLTILSRLSTLSSLSTDASTNIRLGEIMRALDQWDNNVLTVIFGTGLGTSYESISIERAYPFSLDNAYAVVLWKMGLFGLIVFLMIYGSFYIRGFKIYLQSHNTQYKVIAASLMSGLAGLLVIALTNACIIRYRFIVIWVLIIAMIEIMYRDMLSSKTERHSHNK
ncbi:O-antigen ligase family protein [bacterium]|nr:O-antigen ligase family protein [bacterium]